MIGLESTHAPISGEGYVLAMVLLLPVRFRVGDAHVLGLAPMLMLLTACVSDNRGDVGDEQEEGEAMGTARTAGGGEEDMVTARLQLLLLRQWLAARVSEGEDDRGLGEKKRRGAHINTKRTH